ncbi:hypothetical protein KCP73_21415 [Salmonella enterica subsp. enterica]|nr:hypothetical protein KCP73_21415 [Salmonella enterica subsp. enterica]
MPECCSFLHRRRPSVISIEGGAKITPAALAWVLVPGIDGAGAKAATDAQAMMKWRRCGRGSPEG